MDPQEILVDEIGKAITMLRAAVNGPSFCRQDHATGYLNGLRKAFEIVYGEKDYARLVSDRALRGKE